METAHVDKILGKIYLNGIITPNDLGVFYEIQSNGECNSDQYQIRVSERAGFIRGVPRGSKKVTPRASHERCLLEEYKPKYIHTYISRLEN